MLRMSATLLNDYGMVWYGNATEAQSQTKDGRP